jgi:hypothetical protein
MQKRQLGMIFDIDTPLKMPLYRGQRPDARGDSILYPILKAFLKSNGQERPADIKTYTKNGVLWVDAESGGVSLFDMVGIPMRGWNYYKIEINGKIPIGLVITKDREYRSYKPKYGEMQPSHYTIHPNWDMPLKQFLMLLDNFVTQFNRVN